MNVTETKRAAYRELRPQVLQLGFAKVARQQRYNLSLGDGVHGFLAFSDTTKKSNTAVWVAVAAGLVFSEIEKFVSEWCGDALENLSTVHTNIGYLGAHGKWFEVGFPVGDPVHGGVMALLDVVRSDVVPFLRAHADYMAVARLLEQGVPMNPLALEERLPLAYALAGDLDRAYDALDRLAEKVDSGDNPYRLPRRLGYLDGFRAAFPH